MLRRTILTGFVKGKSNYSKAMCHTFFLFVSFLLCLQLRRRHRLVNMLVNGYLRHTSCNNMDYF